MIDKPSIYEGRKKYLIKNNTYYHIISLQQYAIIALIECKQTTLTGEM